MPISSEKRLLWSLAVTFVILAGETVGGIISNSLALLSDAGHVLTDAFALGMSLVASMIGRRPADFRATYGYQRIGLLVALVNGGSLVVMAIFILIESYRRFVAPPQIDASLMLVVASLGLVGNLIMTWIIGGGHKDLNMRSAWLHVLGDTVSSIGVIAAGLIIQYTGWRAADPIAGVLVAAMIIFGGIRVIKEALWIFLEWSPAGFHPDEIAARIAAVPGVTHVHDVHIWSIGHGVPAFSGHVQVGDQKISEADCIRKEIEHRLAELGVMHSVIQMECAECNVSQTYCATPFHPGAHDH